MRPRTDLACFSSGGGCKLCKNISLAGKVAVLVSDCGEQCFQVWTERQLITLAYLSCCFEKVIVLLANSNCYLLNCFVRKPPQIGRRNKTRGLQCHEKSFKSSDVLLTFSFEKVWRAFGKLHMCSTDCHLGFIFRSQKRPLILVIKCCVKKLITWKANQCSQQPAGGKHLALPQSHKWILVWQPCSSITSCAKWGRALALTFLEKLILQRYR